MYRAAGPGHAGTWELFPELSPGPVPNARLHLPGGQVFSIWEVPRPEAFQMDSFISRVSSSSDEMTIHGGSDANPDPCPSFEAGSSAACCPSLVTPGPLQRRLSVNYTAKLARAAKPKANCGPEDSDGSNRGGDKDKGKPAGLGQNHLGQAGPRLPRPMPGPRDGYGRS